MSDSEQQVIRPTRRILLQVIVVPAMVIILAGGAAAWITRGLSTEILFALVLTTGTALAGGATAGLIGWKLPDLLVQAPLAAMAVRMLLTLGGIVVVALTFSEMGTSFFIYTIIFYLIGLISETLLAVKKLMIDPA